MNRETFFEILVIALALIVFFLVALLWAQGAFGQTQKFNPMEGRWETTYPDSQLRFNAPEGEWQYVTPRERSRDSWDDRQDRRDSYQEVQPSFNTFEGRWEFPK